MEKYNRQAAISKLLWFVDVTSSLSRYNTTYYNIMLKSLSVTPIATLLSDMARKVADSLQSLIFLH